MAEGGSASVGERLKIAVIGAGVIGVGVAFTCARAGHAVLLVDHKDKDWSDVTRELRAYQRRWRFAEPASPVVDVEAILLTNDVNAITGAQLIIENVTETWEAKQAAYEALAGLRLEDVTIAANTSAIPITRLATLAPNPNCVVGVHFMNPVDRIGMVEIVRGTSTSVDALSDVMRFLATIGKEGVVVADSPGFVINRLLMVMISQAAQLLADGVATTFEIDQLFKRCLGHAMGPLRTADLIGIDTVVNTLQVLHDSHGDAMFKPAEKLVEMVRNRNLGVKTGQGFYAYSSEI